MDITDKIFCFLASLLIAGLGCLMIKYPHAMDGGDLTHTSGRGGFISLLILIIFIITLKLMWNVIGGSILILFSLFGIIGIILSLFSDSKHDKIILSHNIKQPVQPTEIKNNLRHPLLSQIGQIRKSHLPKKIIEEKNNLSKPIVSHSIKLGRKYIQHKIKEYKK